MSEKTGPKKEIIEIPDIDPKDSVCLTCRKYPCAIVKATPEPPVADCDLWEASV